MKIFLNNCSFLLLKDFVESDLEYYSLDDTFDVHAIYRWDSQIFSTFYGSKQLKKDTKQE